MPRLLPLLALVILLGCATTPTPKYAVGLPATEPIAVPAARLELRMSEDLRAYANPLILHSDGTVTPCRALSYYAPVELALARALRDVSCFDGADTLRLTVRDLHADLRGSVPLARVTLADARNRIFTRTVPLPSDWAAPQLREALAALLLQAYVDCVAGEPNGEVSSGSRK